MIVPLTVPYVLSSLYLHLIKFFPHVARKMTTMQKQSIKRTRRSHLIGKKDQKIRYLYLHVTNQFKNKKSGRIGRREGT